MKFNQNCALPIYIPVLCSEKRLRNDLVSRIPIWFLVVHPECFDFVGSSSSASWRLSSSIQDSAFISAIKQTAKDNAIWVSLGGMHRRPSAGSPTKTTTAPTEPDDATGKVFNSHVVIDDCGEIRSIYDKLHLFSVDIQGGPSLDEHRFSLPGSVYVRWGEVIERCCVYDCRYDAGFSVRMVSPNFASRGSIILCIAEATLSEWSNLSWSTPTKRGGGRSWLLKRFIKWSQQFYDRPSWLTRHGTYSPVVLPRGKYEFPRASIHAWNLLLNQHHSYPIRRPSHVLQQYPNEW